MNGHVGFTGTRHGMTEAQAEAAIELMRGAEWLHHGDCIGADAAMHQAAIELGMRIFLHPPTDPRARAFCNGHLAAHPLPYIDRNHAIVDNSDSVIAAPGDGWERLRSGTWATWRYAKKVGKPWWLVMPDGSVTTT